MALADLSTEFVGRRGRLFKLALVTSVLTVLTLGIYRFWMKTRLRRFYWSSIRPGGHPFESLGEPLEKLLGFLVAVVVLAFYIGVVNLILMFASFSLLNGPVAAYALSFVGIIPIIFYAQYRARRYVLARTRWRGIRFGLDPGAWGYALRAMGHWLITLLSAGLLWPRMTFWLEKYRTDRTWFGDLQLNQGGTWTMLYPAAKHLVIGVVLTGLVALWFYLSENEAILGLLTITVSYLVFGVVYYRVNAFRILTGAKTADGLALVSAPRTGRVIGIYIGGSILIYLCLLGVLIGGLVIIAIVAGAVAGNFDIDAMFEATAGSRVPAGLAIGLGLLAYFAFFILIGVLNHVFLTMPLLKHYAETMTVTGTERLTRVAQRDRDASAEAEGFAEALDLGAAI